jgi:hypothetical protein
MKKLVFFSAMALTTGMLIFSCQKTAVTPNQTTAQNVQSSNNSPSQRLNGGTLVTKKRSYTWINDKLDCSKDGSGCEVSALYVTSTETIDLSVMQVLKLMEIGKVDLNDYFVHNNQDLRDIFPELYDKSGLGLIASNKVKLVFQFPYLLIFDDQGALSQAYNYEATLSDNNVVSALKQAAAAGGYDKKAELNTDVNNPVVWKCISDGSNCKTSAATAFTFNGPWIVENYQYLYVPTKDPISKAELTKDQTQITLTTVTNQIFVFEL